MFSKKPFVIFFIISSLILAVLFSIFSFKEALQRVELPVLNQVEGLHLTDAQERPFTSENLRGKIWVIHFFFTTCADICPMLSKQMAQLYRSFELQEGINFLSITVNPENDTPIVLAKYAQKFKIKPNRWYFTTGSRENITELVVKTFKLGSVEEPTFHSAYFTLVDRKGKIRGYYDATQEQEINRLFKEISSLFKEQK